MRQQKMIDCYYTFQATRNDGSIAESVRIEPHKVRDYLFHIRDLEVDQVENAIHITLNNPGQPYDLHRASNGEIVWTARLIFNVTYWRTHEQGKREAKRTGIQQ